MTIKAMSKDEAWRIITAFYPNTAFELDKKLTNTYFATDDSPIAYVREYSHRLEVSMMNETRFDIQIQGHMQLTNFVIGVIKETVPFGDLVINEVVETDLPDCEGFVLEALDDGKQGIVFYRQDDEKASFHVSNIAYVKVK